LDTEEPKIVGLETITQSHVNEIVDLQSLTASHTEQISINDNDLLALQDRLDTEEPKIIALKRSLKVT
jgi:hypothetical protein